MTKINKLMFREYDLRGRENKGELNVKSVNLIGKAYGTFLRDDTYADDVLGSVSF